MNDMRQLTRQMGRHLLKHGQLFLLAGSSSPEQMAQLAEAVQAGQRVGEIGFNAGFSSLAFLSVPDVRVTSFELKNSRAVKAAKKFVDRRHPARHELILGDSRKTVPAYAAQHPDTRFDVVFIDGGHDYEVAKADLMNMRPLCTQDTVVVMDDVTPWRKWGIGPARAWDEALAQGLARQEKAYQDGRLVEVIEPPGTRSWVIGRYVFSH